jgi:hypothetical protein
VKYVSGQVIELAPFIEMNKEFALLEAKMRSYFRNGISKAEDALLEDIIHANDHKERLALILILELIIDGCLVATQQEDGNLMFSATETFRKASEEQYAKGFNKHCCMETSLNGLCNKSCPGYNELLCVNAED